MSDRQPKINDWDLAIMEKFPYRYAPRWDDRDNWAHMHDMIEWGRTNIGAGGFTWKSMVFFFKSGDDMLGFMLRWS